MLRRMPRAIDQVLAAALYQPRVLQFAGVVLGALLAALALRPLVAPAAALPAGVARDVVPTVVGAPAESAGEEASVLAVVADYNQASITAAVLNTTEPIALLLTSDGSAWAAVQTEYARRAARGETHAPALTRWGVLTVSVLDDTATVATQEQWDDITSVGGMVIASRRGILTRNVYMLQRSLSGAGWQIAAVTSTTLIG